eukprot:TRINITY_DN15093_c0_g1_i1.p1 TRINITY_DN15093_c0_g1~~TRINITY_DN15093_c0_g1_i1.p1  ORF type:complete len:272 (+),score=35.71 TRINITY_DN15093_c0_g1_i1:93-908(+)
METRGCDGYEFLRLNIECPAGITLQAPPSNTNKDLCSHLVTCAPQQQLGVHSAMEQVSVSTGEGAVTNQFTMGYPRVVQFATQGNTGRESTNLLQRGHGLQSDWLGDATHLINQAVALGDFRGRAVEFPDKSRASASARYPGDFRGRAVEFPDKSRASASARYPGAVQEQLGFFNADVGVSEPSNFNDNSRQQPLLDALEREYDRDYDDVFFAYLDDNITAALDDMLEDETRNESSGNTSDSQSGVSTRCPAPHAASLSGGSTEDQDPYSD